MSRVPSDLLDEGDLCRGDAGGLIHELPFSNLTTNMQVLSDNILIMSGANLSCLRETVLLIRGSKCCVVCDLVLLRNIAASAARQTMMMNYSALLSARAVFVRILSRGSIIDFFF